MHDDFVIVACYLGSLFIVELSHPVSEIISVANSLDFVVSIITIFNARMPNKKNKGFRCSPLSSSGSKSISKPKRPQRRKQWAAEQIEAALYSVTHDGLSGNKAADLHGYHDRH